MKTKIESVEPAFTPLTLSITFETQLELDALATLFNHTTVIDGTEKVFGVNFAEISRSLIKGSKADPTTRINALTQQFISHYK